MRRRTDEAVSALKRRCPRNLTKTAHLSIHQPRGGRNHVRRETQDTILPKNPRLPLCDQLNSLRTREAADRLRRVRGRLGTQEVQQKDTAFCAVHRRTSRRAWAKRSATLSLSPCGDT